MKKIDKIMIFNKMWLLIESRSTAKMLKLTTLKENLPISLTMVTRSGRISTTFPLNLES
jgi:hypothetical protein